MQIEITVERKGVESLKAKLKKISANMINYAEKGLNQALTETQEYALDKKVGIKSKDKIKIESTTKRKVVEGRVYTDKNEFSYASFIEYGTGTYAELPHIGVTDEFYRSGFSRWFLPLYKVPANKRADMHNPIVMLNVYEHGQKTGERFPAYVMFSQEPRPFMRPTAFYRRDKNISVIAKNIREGIKDDIK